MSSAEIRIANQLAEISKVADLVDAFGQRHALPERVRNDMNIAVDEIISNIIHHSYRDDASHSIAVSLRLLPGELHAEIVDDGAAFDPLSNPAAKPSGSVRERALGGLGLHLVTSLMDNVRYVRRGDSNHLTLIKKTGGPANPPVRAAAMRFSAAVENGVTVVAISGRFDSGVAREIRERLLQLVAGGASRILLDLRGVEYISSAGFWSLLAVGRAIEARQGNLVLCGVDGEVRRLFDLSGFAGLFKVCPTRELGIETARGSAS